MKKAGEAGLFREAWAPTGSSYLSGNQRGGEGGRARDREGLAAKKTGFRLLLLPRQQPHPQTPRAP